MRANAPALLVRARIATCAIFLVFGVALGVWTARIPAIKQNLALSDGQLSLVLLSFAAGAIAGMQLAGRLVDRFGSGRLLPAAAAAEGVALVAPAFAPSLVTLALALFAFGAVHGALNIVMNANAVQIQRGWPSPIITSFHAAYSVGGFLGAVIGGLFALADAGVPATFGTVAVGVVVVALLTRGWVLNAPVPQSADSAAASRSPQWTRDIVLLGLLAFCCLVGEGSAADWSTVYLRESLGSTAAFAAAAYAAFSIAMVAGRLTGDRLVARFGAVGLVRASALLSALGLSVALLVSHPIAGVIGFGCLGAGLACIAPQVFAAAGNRDPARAGQAIARVAAMGYAGFLVGPVLIGAAAQLSSLRVALVVPVLLTLLVAAMAITLRAADPGFAGVAQSGDAVDEQHHAVGGGQPVL
ncbi:MFS transporter [Rhizocola hellebori]|uniref:MFS transporter n=1 Tax=Rhizocola hellebori TaxID=1392758 RepID=A0A8J3QBJ6_9ACTN|nr:MFS transporter [Rhizocola hellebori]GIH06727.1 MFS transporter [Rhizocola hellebori]